MEKKEGEEEEGMLKWASFSSLLLHLLFRLDDSMTFANRMVMWGNGASEVLFGHSAHRSGVEGANRDASPRFDGFSVSLRHIPPQLPYSHELNPSACRNAGFKASCTPILETQSTASF